MAEDLKRVESYQYPAAHLGHLTNNQQKSLDQFKELCQQKGYYKPAGPSGVPYASHDDETLLRYLRARKFDPKAAFGQLKDTEDWRKQNHIEELYDTIDVHEYDEARKLYPQWTGRRDRRGIPVYVFEVSHLDSKTVSKYTKMVSKNPTVAHKNSTIPSKLLTLFALYENLTRFVLPFCSAMKDRPHPETPVSQSSNIVDISNVGLRQFWNLKTHMQDASQLATAHYPETLDRIFILGAPAFFPTVWGWIKRWFDPITVSKIFILSQSDTKKTLEKYIDPANIPKKYGGQLDFKFGDMPVLEPAILDSLDLSNGCSGLPKQRGAATLPIGPIKWREGRGEDMEAIAVGRGDDGMIRDQVIARVHTDFKGMHGIARSEGPPQNTPIDWSLEKIVTTPGTETHIEEGDLLFGQELASESNTSGTNTPLPVRTKDNSSFNTDREEADNSTLQQPESTMDPAISKNGPNNTSATLPAKPIEVNHDSIPVGESQPRTGTSESKFAQQDRTHAEGTLQENTPHVVDYGHGEKTTTVEPRTVGQAPKDVSAILPSKEGEEQQQQAQGVLGQVTEYAEKAYEEAVNVVSGVAEKIGLGSAKHDESKPVESKEEKKDESVEGVDAGNVEEFLRSKYPSEGAKANAAHK